MIGFKKIFIYTLLTLVVVYVIIWVGSSAYIAWKGYTFQKQTEEFQAALSRPYREDAYGGKTPEETWGLFLDALKKGDVDLASKYFVPEKQEEWKENINNTIKAGKLDAAIKNIQKINLETSTSEVAYFSYPVSSAEIPGITKNRVVFILNPYTKVWKISFL